MFPTLVLDNNVVFDWLVFHDPSTLPLAAEIGAGRVHWIATVAMRDELEHVLARGRLDRWQPDLAAIRASWDSWASICDAPDLPAPPALRCSDRDDQKFIDLALHRRADALLSHDRAVLRLAGRARRVGLTISSPAAWFARHAPLG